MMFLFLLPLLALLVWFVADWARGVLYWDQVHHWVQGLIVGACTAAFFLLDVGAS